MILNEYSRTHPKHVLKAQRITWDLEEPDNPNREWCKRVFSKMPSKFSEPIAKIYREIYLSQGSEEARGFLLDIDQHIYRDTFLIGSSPESLTESAKKRAHACDRLTRRPLKYINDLKGLYASLAFYAERYDIQAPKITKKMTYQSAIARLKDQQWWKRQLRTKYHRELEGLAIGTGLVHKYSSIYVSEETLNRRRQQKQSNTEYLEHTSMENEEGDSFTLQELMSSSVANPRNRRNELMCRIAGFEAMAKESGHMGLFLTLTCPSRMHARYSKTGQANKNYDGTTPRESNDYLNKIWSKVRAKFKRDGIDIYGFRVAEPQHDGTPHWHLLLFSEKKNLKAINNTFKHYALEDNPNEPGAKEHRFQTVAIDWTKGTATGYIAKYISKNIDGEHVDKDLYGNDATSTAERVDAWASVWGIRQFQQFGGSPVGIWRELRRGIEMPEGVLKDAYEAADDGNWQLFVELLGGHHARQKDIPVQLEKKWNDHLGKYGEPIGYQIFGLTDGLNVVETRIHEWRVRLTSEKLESQAHAVPQAAS